MKNWRSSHNCTKVVGKQKPMFKVIKAQMFLQWCKSALSHHTPLALDVINCIVDGLVSVGCEHVKAMFHNRNYRVWMGIKFTGFLDCIRTTHAATKSRTTFASKQMLQCRLVWYCNWDIGPKRLVHTRQNNSATQVVRTMEHNWWWYLDGRCWL